MAERAAPTVVASVAIIFVVAVFGGSAACAQPQPSDGAGSRADPLSGYDPSKGTTGPSPTPQSAPPPTSIPGWFSQSKMLGSLFGVRPILSDNGIDLELKYTSEVAGNPVGGLDQAGRYTQQVNLSLKADLERLLSLDGTYFTFTLNDRVGRDLKPVIGSLRSPQEVYGAGQNFRLAELSVVKKMFSDHLELEVGFEAVGSDFATSTLYCYFQSGMFCGHTPALSSNSGGYNYPTGQWGANIKVKGHEVYLQFGTYEANSKLTLSGYGFDLSFNGSTAVLLPVEIGWQPKFGPQDLPGTYKLGGYYETSRAKNVLNDVGLDLGFSAGRHGIYIQGEQMLVRT